MTKLLRFAGVALLALTIGVFGCGDDDDPVAPTVTVTVPTPPTPPTPPPPPLAATMTPDAQTIGVGGTVVFAVSVSGGVAGEAASWTCASSDPSKATVSVVPVGCQATAVAVGGTSITAVVTKGGATTNAGAGLTITEDAVESAFMALASIEDSDDDDAVLSGKVSVTLNVERGDETLMQLSVLVDGVVAAILPFGDISAVAAPQDGPAQQQAVHAFVLSFNSAEYDAVTGEPTYMNGERTISAELMVAGKDEPYGSGAHNVEFGNDDGYVVTADLGDNSEIGDDGRRWYGGPGNGTIDIAALPVSYSGGSVTSVSANFCGEEATDSNGADGYTFEFECEDRESNTDGDEAGDMLTISSPGEEDGEILNDDHPFPAFVDFVGPTESPIIVANRNGREMGWLNAAVALTGEVDEDDDDNWLVEGADETGGIGGYNMMLLMGDDLEKALEASPGSTLPAESATNASYCAIASATDDLGNMSELPDDDATCREAPAGADALVDHDNDDMTPDVYGYDETPEVDTDPVEDVSGQTLEFGVDTTVPAIDDIDGDMRYTAAPSAFSFDAFDDEGVASGDNLHSVLPLMVRTQRRDASGSECLTIPDDGTVPSGADDRDCDETTDLAEDGTVTFDSPTAAYYTLWASARDQAGNRSAEVSHTFVFDDEMAEATAPAVPGIIDAGEAFSMATSLNDNLSIRDYYVTTDYAINGTAIELGVGLPQGVDDFDAASLTHRNHNILTGALPQPYKGLQDSPDDDEATAIAGVTVAVRDQTQANYGTDAGVQTLFAVEDPDGIDDDGFTVAFSDIDAVCVAEDEDDCAEANRESETTLEVVATAAATGSFNKPFDGVDFWMMDVNGAHWKLPVTASAEAGRTDDRRRTWTYSVEVPAATLRMMTREADFPPGTNSDSHTVRMFAVDDGIAVTLSNPVTIDDGDDDN